MAAGPAKRRHSGVWNLAEEVELLAMVSAGSDFHAVARQLGRSAGAVVYRMRQLRKDGRLRYGLCKHTVATVALADHYTGNATRSSEAGTKGETVKRELRAEGIDLRSGGRPALTREAVTAVVIAIEAGAKVAAAVKRGGMAYSAYHAGLARHPDLRARHYRARKRV